MPNYEYIDLYLYMGIDIMMKQSLEKKKQSVASGLARYRKLCEDDQIDCAMLDETASILKEKFTGHTIEDTTDNPLTGFSPGIFYVDRKYQVNAVDKTLQYEGKEPPKEFENLGLTMEETMDYKHIDGYQLMLSSSREDIIGILEEYQEMADELGVLGIRKEISKNCWSCSTDGSIEVRYEDTDGNGVEWQHRTCKNCQQKTKVRIIVS